MNKFYQGVFYPEALKEAYISAGTWPEHAADVNDEVMAVYSQYPPEGKMLGTDNNGYPVWVDIPLPDIDDVRSQKHDEINAWRNNQENANYTFTFDNHKWDYGKATQERLTLSVQMAKANKLPAGFIWTDADNNDVPMSAGELLNLSDAIDQAMFTTGLQIHLRQRQMKEEIDKLTDAQAVLDYVVGWPDIPTK
ncbi:DUF4376 domain-containing protein [Salmonella enterica]